MPVQQDALVALGVVARPHGIRGEIRVHLFNPDSELLLKAKEYFLRRDGNVWPEPVKRARADKEALIVALDGCNTRNDAEALKGAEVCLPRTAFAPLEDGEYYHVDLIGLKAVSPTGDDLGVVTDVIT